MTLNGVMAVILNSTRAVSATTELLFQIPFASCARHNWRVRSGCVSVGWWCRWIVDKQIKIIFAHYISVSARTDRQTPLRTLPTLSDKPDINVIELRLLLLKQAAEPELNILFYQRDRDFWVFEIVVKVADRCR